MVVFFWPVMRPEIYPAHDSYLYFFPQYLYFANSIYHGFGIPDWFPSGGGHPILLTAVSESYFLPYRILGWLIYFLPVSPITAYKLTLLSGVGGTALAWWFFLKRSTGTRLAASFGVVLLFVCGSSITMFHQETVLMNIVWIPWFLLVISYIPKDFRFIVLAGIIAGLGLTAYSAPVFFLTVLGVLATPVCLSYAKQLLKSIQTHPIVTGIAAVGFLCSSLITIYTLFGVDGFVSPVRAGQISFSSIEEYVQSIKWGMSANVEYYKNYIDPKSGVFLDQFAFFLPKIGLALAALSFLFIRNNWQIWLSFALVTIVVLMASSGTEFGFAQFLYSIKTPIIKYFRNWVHFVSILNLALIALASLGLAAIIKMISATRASFLSVMFFLGSVVIAAQSGADYFNKYIDYVLTKHDSYKVSAEFQEQLSEDQFLAIIRGGWYKELRRVWLREKQPHAGLCDILVSQEWWDLLDLCPQVTERTAFSAGPATKLCKAELDYPILRNSIPLLSYTLYDESSVAASEKVVLFKTFCENDGFQFSAIAVSPPENSVSGIDIRPLGEVAANGILGKHQNKVFPYQSLQISPKGATLNGATVENAFVLLPFSYRLGLHALVNEEPTILQSAYGGALSGVHVPSGDFTIEVFFPAYSPKLLIYLQFLMTVLAIILGIFLMRANRDRQQYQLS
jgi:hypothetical protein